MAERPVLVVVDRRVDDLYGTDLRTYFEQETNLLGYLVIDGSENTKSWSPVHKICDAAIDIQLPRDGVMAAVGGGVTLDITGFAASIFRRGVHFVRIPTSLIGLIDVGVGIKHGINVGGKKSIVGSFYPPMANINDPTFLRTLPQRHVACGVAEIVKMAVVRDADLFGLVERHVSDFVAQRFQNSSVAQDVLIRSEHLMMQELQPNLFESELRRLPDFGHTFSPAIEIASRWSINHGEAVAMDMLISTAIALNKGLCSETTFERLRNVVHRAGLAMTHEVCRPVVLMKGLQAARQHRSGNLNLVVPLEIGKADFIQDVTFDEIEQALALLGGELERVCTAGRSWRNTSQARNVP